MIQSIIIILKIINQIFGIRFEVNQILGSDRMWSDIWFWTSLLPPKPNSYSYSLQLRQMWCREAVKFYQPSIPKVELLHHHRNQCIPPIGNYDPGLGREGRRQLIPIMGYLHIYESYPAMIQTYTFKFPFSVAFT